MSPLAWIAVQVHRTADLPHREISQREYRRRAAATRAKARPVRMPRATAREKLCAALDSEWRAPRTLASRSGTSQGFVYQELPRLVASGLAEVREDHGWRVAHKLYRRAAP